MKGLLDMWYTLSDDAQRLAIVVMVGAVAFVVAMSAFAC